MSFNDEMDVELERIQASLQKRETYRQERAAVAGVLTGLILTLKVIGDVPLTGNEAASLIEPMLNALVTEMRAEVLITETEQALLKIADGGDLA